MKHRSPDRVSSILSGSFSTLKIPALLREAKILKSWPICVGKGIARNARADRLIGSTLHCVVSSATWMSELNYQKRTIIDRINRELGEEAVTEIVFKPGPVEPPADGDAPGGSSAPPSAMEEDAGYGTESPEKRRFIDEAVSGVRDPALRDAIERALKKADLDE